VCCSIAPAVPGIGNGDGVDVLRGTFVWGWCMDGMRASNGGGVLSQAWIWTFGVMVSEVGV